MNSTASVPPRGFAFRSRELGDPEIACRDVIPSAAGFRFRYVTLNLFGVGADNGADEKAPTIVNVNLWNRVDIELLRHRRVPIDDVDLAQRTIGIGAFHLRHACREHFTLTPPVRIKIDTRHLPELG